VKQTQKTSTTTEMRTTYRLISVWTLALIGSLLLPMVSIAAVSGTTYSHVPTTTTTPAIFAEHASIAGTDSASSVDLQDMPIGRSQPLFALCRSFVAPKSAGVKYIGKMDDLQGIPRRQTLLDDLPNLGSPKANYYQNSSVLRKAVGDGYQIRDASAYRPNWSPDPTFLRPDRTVGQSFLGAERLIMDQTTRASYSIPAEHTSRSEPMSQATQDNFERLVSEYHRRHENALSLSGPSFRRDGYTITATMLGSNGRVEMRCGPAEYNTEIFIYNDDDRRWTSADLIGNDHVRVWLEQNRPSTSDRSRLDSEIDCAFGLLTAGLKGVDGFEWLYTRPRPPRTSQR